MSIKINIRDNLVTTLQSVVNPAGGVLKHFVDQDKVATCPTLFVVVGPTGKTPASEDQQLYQASTMFTIGAYVSASVEAMDVALDDIVSAIESCIMNNEATICTATSAESITLTGNSALFDEQETKALAIVTVNVVYYHTETL